MYPKDFFEGLHPDEELGRCFVLMPFASEFDAVYEAIAEAMESDEVGFECKRADELFGGGHVMADVLGEVARAEVVIADVSNRNPNVFYELGVVHTVKDVSQVLILTQDMSDVPFDIRPFRIMSYAIDDLPRLKRDLVAAIGAVARESFQMTVEAGSVMESPRKILGLDRWMYSLRIPELYVEPGFAKFRLVVTKAAIGQQDQVVFDDGAALEVGESMPLVGVDWSLSLARVDGAEAAFRVTREGARDEVVEDSPLSGKQRVLLETIAAAGEHGIYVMHLERDMGLDRETIVYRAKDLDAQGLIRIDQLTDLSYSVTRKGRAALA